jgi:hypothetical protein
MVSGPFRQNAKSLGQSLVPGNMVLRIAGVL